MAPSTSSSIMLASVLLQHALAFPTSLLERQAASTVPDFVTKYAPLVWLHPQETYMPSDIGAQLKHTTPENNFVKVPNVPSPLTLSNLNQLNALNGSNIYLTSNDDVTTNPTWLNGVKPDGTGKTDGAVSCAVIVNDRGSGRVDAFYMYFYAYNWGGVVLGSLVDDHVGDWEHTMVRFQDGTPSQMWFSQHAFGEAFTYKAVEKQGLRPVAYSGNGSHANYAISGTHDHTLPDFNLPGVGIVTDYTDQGTLWDPILSCYFYSFNPTANSYTAYDSSYPTEWLSFVGKWGDEQYPDSDPRQHKIFGIDASAQYSSGPTGPEDKQLNRTDVCPTGEFCYVQEDAGP